LTEEFISVAAQTENITALWRKRKNKIAKAIAKAIQKKVLLV
jgi:hypothetical protein